jgi:AAA family ATP:ADP antiporter
LRTLFGVEAGEGNTISLMVLLYFAVSGAFVLVQTTAFGLFIEEFGSHDLPYAYLSVAVLASLIAFGYLKLSERLSFNAVQFANLGFLISMCLAFWAGLNSAFAHWFIFLLPFWFQTLVNQANLIVWHLAGHLFHVRQAKRLFGLIAAGNWLANILGGLGVAALLAFTGTATAYFLAALALVIAGFILWAVMGGPGGSATQPPVQAAATPAKTAQPAGSPFRHPYSRLIFAYTLLWWIAFVFIDNIFFDRAGVEFPDATVLASFIGGQLSVMGVIAIITTLFVTSRVASRYGLRVGLLIMPVVVTASILVLAVGGSLGWTNDTLFWIATVAKTLNVALGFSLSQVMGSLLFQPLPGSQRGATQTVSEGIMQPVAFGLAGLILLVFNTSLHFNAVGLSYLFLPVAALWLGVILSLSRQYPLVMSEALRKRTLGETTTLVFDPAAAAQLRQGLQHPRAGPALYALSQLEQLAPQTWPETLRQELPRLLEHAAPEVRREALRKVLLLKLATVMPLLRARLPLETEPDVYSMLIQVLATLRDPDSETRILEALDSPQLTVRRGAIIGVLASTGAGAAGRAGEALARMVRSSRAADRVLAAEILSECDYPDCGAQLTRLLADDDITVRHAAIRAAGRQEDTRLLHAVLAACDKPETARLAEQVLAGRGVQAVAVMAEHLSAAGPVPRERVLSMMRILGRIREASSTDLLLSKLAVPDSQVRLQALLSLSAHGFRAPSRERIFERIQAEVIQAAWLTGALERLGRLPEADKVRVLESALEIAFRQARSRILILLSFAFDAQAVSRARTALEEASTHYSPYALETVDALLPVRLKPLVLPLIENIPYAARLELWQAAGIEAVVPRLDTILRSLIGHEGESSHDLWTRLCAMHVAAVLGERSCAPALERLLNASHPVIGDMSRWSLGRLASDPHLEGDGKMLSLVEKVLILKSAPLFSDTPDNVLADIADFVEELSVEEGQIIFNKGDRGDSLYIIVSGHVQVWEGERVLNELGDGDIFGELALLDPEPRLATVKPTESTHLLRLDEAHFREVLAVRPEVSTAIIRVITRYLRTQLQYAREVNAKLRSLESFGFLSNPAQE